MKRLQFLVLIFFAATVVVFAQEKAEKLGPKTVKQAVIDKADSPTAAIKKTNGTATVASYDFTAAGAAYTTGPDPMVQVDTGVWAMIAGDANADGAIDATDLNSEWRPNNGQPWSYSIGADFNLDGSIDATDLNIFWRPNNGKSTQVP